MSLADKILAEVDVTEAKKKKNKAFRGYDWRKNKPMRPDKNKKFSRTKNKKFNCESEEKVKCGECGCSVSCEASKCGKCGCDLAEMNHTLYSSHKAPQRDNCRACGGATVPSGVGEGGSLRKCKDCGSEFTQKMSHFNTPVEFKEGQEAELSIDMDAEDREIEDVITAEEGFKMETPPEGHFYGRPKKGNVTKAKNSEHKDKKKNGKFFCKERNLSRAISAELAEHEDQPETETPEEPETPEAADAPEEWDFERA